MTRLTTTTLVLYYNNNLCGFLFHFLVSLSWSSAYYILNADILYRKKEDTLALGSFFFSFFFSWDDNKTEFEYTKYKATFKIWMVQHKCSMSWSASFKFIHSNLYYPSGNFIRVLENFGSLLYSSHHHRERKRIILNEFKRKSSNIWRQLQLTSRTTFIWKWNGPNPL